MVKTIFNLLIRYHIRKISFSSVHIFVRASPLISSTVCMYPISIIHFQINTFNSVTDLMQKTAYMYLCMVLELNCMYQRKKSTYIHKAQYTYSLHKAQATKYW